VEHRRARFEGEAIPGGPLRVAGPWARSSAGQRAREVAGPWAPAWASRWAREVGQRACEVASRWAWGVASRLVAGHRRAGQGVPEARSSLRFAGYRGVGGIGVFGWAVRVGPPLWGDHDAGRHQIEPGEEPGHLVAGAPA
jgi:hypothetical protein